MKKVVIFVVITLFLLSIISASIVMTNKAIDNICTDSDNGKDYSIKGTTTLNSETQTDSCEYCTGACIEGQPCSSSCGAVLEFYCENDVIKNETHVCDDNKICENGACIRISNNENNETELETQGKIKGRLRDRLTDEQIKKIFTIKNRIKNIIAPEDCPEKCACVGSVIKCLVANGTREMTIIAGKSGNLIVQVKGMNASTNVTLYKSPDGKLYAVLKNNETKIIKLFPDQVREKIRAKFSRNFDNESITLNEDGTYSYVGEKKAKLFFLFPVKSKVRAEFDSETGKIISIKHPWWAFMSKDENADTIVGASCGTVTPGENDNCCESGEFDLWNATTEECQFNSE